MTDLIQHNTIQHADTHEPKHITTSGVTDSGKVITPSDTQIGVSELRRLNSSDIVDNIYMRECLRTPWPMDGANTIHDFIVITPTTPIKLQNSYMYINGINFSFNSLNFRIYQSYNTESNLQLYSLDATTNLSIVVCPIPLEG